MTNEGDDLGFRTTGILQSFTEPWTCLATHLEEIGVGGDSGSKLAFIKHHLCYVLGAHIGNCVTWIWQSPYPFRAYTLGGEERTPHGK